MSAKVSFPSPRSLVVKGIGAGVAAVVVVVELDEEKQAAPLASQTRPLPCAI